MTIGIFILGGMVNWAARSTSMVRFTEDREQILNIAEAGIEYYRWHLAHDATDFQDGTGLPGPYVHDFFDKDGVRIGQYSLMITPPPTGSTLVVIRSTGSLDAVPGSSRTIETRLAKPSWAKFSVVANADIRFGEGTEVFGPIHSNGGIRFDGLIHNIITSAQTKYDDPDHGGGQEFGVHTHVSPTDPLPPAAAPSRTDVFEVGRQFGVPAVDFSGLSADLAQIKTDAQADGLYYGPSGGQGYLMVLKTNDTLDVYRVNSLINTCAPSWSIGTSGGSKTLLGNVPFPSNGLVFVEDNLWVEGKINTARLTLAAATFPDNPATRRNIAVNNDLLYTNYDGQDVISLMAQKDFNIGLKSSDVLRVDAAIVAQYGRVGREYYGSGCGTGYKRSTVTIYGMLASALRYGFAYTDGTGFQIRDIIYDANLLYAPPPSFPLTTDNYQVLSWDEI
ncbi:MAG: hypothetical protein UY04_C0004G0011 [Parcubacteria group bacterium GW2011_GWA2_47_7]|nr:MAG: hypothetical protein UY04_C0004G0011 [Parcubacteria group bacterium GW2011_GWA2_47_7]